MKSTELSKGKIGTMFSRYDTLLSNIKVRTAGSLFEVKGDFRTLIDDRCPFCGRKLRIMIKRPLVMCLSPNCVADPKFKMNRTKYEELKGKIKSK